jgi:hypothetical protein
MNQIQVNNISYTGFWWGNLRERYNFGDQGADEKIILR